MLDHKFCYLTTIKIKNYYLFYLLLEEFNGGDTIRPERNQEIVSRMTFDSTLIPSIHYN